MFLLALALTLAAADPASTRPPETNRAPEMPLVPAVVAEKQSITTPLMAAHAGRITAKASSTWPGWGPEKLVDGDAGTSWFSAGGDAAALGKKPWVELRFPEKVTVQKVSLLGNREARWPKGFSIHYGLLELTDENGAVIASSKNETKNLLADLDFKWKVPVAGVRAVRFTSLMDDGDQTHWKDIALAEVLVE